MAAKKRKRREAVTCEIQMTPMIDVVFQLLIYFIVTIKPIDVAAHLDVFRPAAGQPPKEGEEPPKMIQIQVFQGALIMNDRSVTLETMSEILEKLASLSKTQTVMIQCARDSKHDMLIKVLDRCAKVGLSNLSVVTMN
jgi:biopolymer transport protein ExbD